LTNSALTSGIHFSHRLLVAAPFASVLISIGVSLLADTARRIILGRVAPIVLAGFVTHLGLNVRHHFISERDTEPLSAPHVHGYYALRYLVEYLEPYRATLPRSLCLRVCPSCEIFNTDHSVGFVSFFYPDTAFQVQFDPAFSSYREIGVTSDCGSPMSENPLVANFCERPTLYRCPKELPPLQVRVERRVLREE
jgi:hypothetical protein